MSVSLSRRTGTVMPRPTSDALSLSWRVLRALNALNVVMGVLIFALLIASLVARDWTMTALGAPPATAGPSFFAGMRAIMVIGIVSVPLLHVVLTRLRAIVATVRAGDPFVG